jgi:hypothetical protein
MMTTTLHRAEEHGQSRELKTSEIKATTLMAGIESAALATAAGIAVVTVQGVQGHDLSVWTALATSGVVGGLSFYFHISKNFGELRDGLRVWRSVETFAPQSEPQSQSIHPPILVKPYKGEPYMLGQSERPALPGREPLQLTPPIVAELLQGVVEEYGGDWSRRKLTRLRVAGHKVSRGIYEELTGWLHKAGVLLQTPQGGYALPPDVQTFEDLRAYFPGLPIPGRAGGQVGGRERGASQLTQPDSRAMSLVEKRRRRWLECGCDVERYLAGR